MRTAPAVGRSCPPITRSSVVLPQPLPPMIATTLPRGTLHRDALQDRAAAVGKRHRVDVDQVFRTRVGNGETREGRFYQLCPAPLAYNRLDVRRTRTLQEAAPAARRRRPADHREPRLRARRATTRCTRAATARARWSSCARARAPDLALVDLGLPPAPHLPDEGFKLIGDLLAHSPRVRIFVLTGQNEDSNARHARALGAVEFVAKPCEPAFLRTALARALALAGRSTAATTRGARARADRREPARSPS